MGRVLYQIDRRGGWCFKGEGRYGEVRYGRGEVCGLLYF